MLLGMLHISLVNVLMILSSLQILGLEKGGCIVSVGYVIFYDGVKDANFMMASDVMGYLLCFFAFSIVLYLCVLHLSERTRCIHKYVYGSFWERVGNGLFFNDMIWACMKYLNTMGV